MNKGKIRYMLKRLADWFSAWRCNWFHSGIINRNGRTYECADCLRKIGYDWYEK